MQKEIPKILAINPGSRYVGIALFYGAELREWAVKTLGGDTLAERIERMRKILADFIGHHGVNVLTIKLLHPSRGSKNLRSLVRAIEKIGEQEGLTVYEYPLSEVKHLLFSREGNKRDLAEEIAVRYPFLYPELEREKKSRNPYLTRMFEAVALGVVCFNQLDSKKQKVGRKKK